MRTRESFHFVGLPELGSQTLLFSVFVCRHLNPQEKKVRKSGKITDSFLAAVAVLISRAKEKAENLKMDQALERYKREE